MSLRNMRKVSPAFGHGLWVSRQEFGECVHSFGFRFIRAIKLLTGLRVSRRLGPHPSGQWPEGTQLLVGTLDVRVGVGEGV